VVKIEAKRIKSRSRGAHKGVFGHVFVLAGSEGLTGAAYLTSQAALLSGSGLVTLGIPKGLNAIMEMKLTEVMTLPLGETKDGALKKSCEGRILDFARKAQALAIGPGLSREEETGELVRGLLKKIDKPIVLDADGINAFERQVEGLNDRKAPLVMTPHPGELSRIIGTGIGDIQRDRARWAEEASKRFDAIVVLKGYKTVVADGGSIYINESGNPGMATGGTGDILTGVIASLIGQGLGPFGAAKLGCYVHGVAGDLAVREVGEVSLKASDVLDFLPKAFKAL
jgi:NAD(P)H-hydrate epimerase